VDKHPNYFRTYPRPQKGDLLYADTNGDGELDEDDRMQFGHGPYPTVMYGAQLGCSWKGFDLSCLLQGVGDVTAEAWDGTYDASMFSSNIRYGGAINKTITDGRWYEGRPDKAIYPRLLVAGDNRNIELSNFWLENKAYLKVKNIQVGYTVPKTISRKVLMESIRIYASVDNALTFTKYRVFDPETTGTYYPTFRMTTIGVNLNF
jgi:hypothetical protein